MTRLWKKRLTFLAVLTAFPVNAVLGDWHGHKYGGHPWKADPADINDRMRRNP